MNVFDLHACSKTCWLIGRNFIVTSVKNFYENMQKLSLENLTKWIFYDGQNTIGSQNQWRSQEFTGGLVGVWVAPATIVGLSEHPPGLSDFCNFSIKITHFMHISVKIVIFNATTHQLKAF